MSRKKPDFSHIRIRHFEYPSWSWWMPKSMRDLFRLGQWYSVVRLSTQDEIDNFEDMYENEIEFKAHVLNVDLSDPYAYVRLEDEMG